MMAKTHKVRLGHIFRPWMKVLILDARILHLTWMPFRMDSPQSLAYAHSVQTAHINPS